LGKVHVWRNTSPILGRRSAFFPSLSSSVRR
jgi:hypothetical protein